MRSIAEKGPDAVNASCLHGTFDTEAQRRFGEKIVTSLGSTGSAAGRTKPFIRSARTSATATCELLPG